MASSSKKDNGWVMFKSNFPHFFKIILDDAIRDKKLYIPRKFARKHGKDLPSKVVLTVPSGAKWQVEVVKCDDRICLQNGWLEFVEYYAIVYGSFLVFSYDQKNCCFNVIIFEKNACEIKYPVGVNRENKDGNLEEEFRETGEQEVDENDPSPSSRKETEETPLRFDQPCKRIKLPNSHSNAYPECHSEHAEGGADFDENKDTRRKSSHKRRFGRTVQMKLTPKEKFKAIEKARTNFESTNPNFLLLMHGSYVEPVYDWALIPTRFAKKHLRVNHKTNAILEGSDGKSWSVVLTHKSYIDRTALRISYGWRKFAQDNHLNVGDVCAFELISHTEMTFKVSIFKNNKAENCSPTSKEKLVLESSNRNMNPKCPAEQVEGTNETILSGNLEAANKMFTSDYPLFKVTIYSSYLQYASLAIPKSFVTEYLKDEGSAILSVLDGRTWFVKYKTSPHGITKMFNGWRKFTQDNHLEINDLCAFELIDRTETKFKVSIFRDKKDSSCSTSGSEMQVKTEFDENSSSSVASEAIISDFTSLHPFFSVVIRSFHLKFSFLVVPVEFFVECQKLGITNVMLMTGNRQWPMKVMARRTCKKGNLYGWREFAKEYSLQVGDVCNFELIKCENVFIKVSVFRHI